MGNGAGTPPGRACPGSAPRKNSLASRVSVATSGSEPATLASGTLSVSPENLIASLASFVLMVVSDFYVLEHTQRIFGQYGCRAIQRHQVRGDRVAVNTHETDRKPRSLFPWQARLKQSYNALLPLPGAQQQDIALPRFVHG